MSYIGLFNETDVSADNIVVTDFVCDTLAVNTSLTSNGTTSINDTTLTGVLNGLLTAVSNGSDITYTYNASTKTFTIQLNNNSINLSKISTTAYTPLNTFSTLVSRDTSGSFRATNITLSGNLSTQLLYVYGTSEIYNDLNFHEGHTINLIPSGGLDCPLICWYTDQSTESINISPLNSTINFFNEFGFNKISLTGSSGKIVCNDINITTGQTYKINNVSLNTDNIQEKTASPINLYYTQGRFNTAFGLKSTTNLSEGTSLYYTQGRFDTAFGLKSTTNLSEGTSLYYTQGRFDNAFGLKSTTNLSEGTSLYYTEGRFDNAFGLKSTTNLSEGTSLYYTQGRFDTAFGLKSTTNLSEGTSLYYTDLRARTAIVPSNTGEINHTYSTATGSLTASINSNSIHPSKISVGFPDQLLVSNHGSTASTWVSMTGHGSLVSGALTITDGAITLAKLSNIYSTQSYPSTLVYRDLSGGASFGTLTVDNTLHTQTIKNTGVIYSSSGLSDITSSLNPTTSLELGTKLSTLNDGVLRLDSTVSESTYSILQSNLGNLYMDNNTTNKSINIGTISNNRVNISNLYTSYIFSDGGVPSITTDTFGYLTKTTYLSGLQASIYGSGNGVIRLSSTSVSQGLYMGTIIQNVSGNTYIDNELSATGNNSRTPNINIGTIIPNQQINIGGSLNTSVSISQLVSIIYPSVSTIVIPLFNYKKQSLLGTVLTNVISPNWARVTATNTLEVSIYSSSVTPTFKIEGIFACYWVSTNTGVTFNVGVTKNSASPATLASLTTMINGDIFQCRNVSGVGPTTGALALVPMLSFYTPSAGYIGDCYTFTVYFQSATSFANGSSIGRTANDIPTNFIVTQLS